MKKYLLLLLLLVPLHSFAASASDYNPFGYWSLDDTSGAALDSTSQSNALTNNNSITYSTFLLNNGANTSAASTQWFSGNVDFDNTTDPFCLSYWVKTTDTGYRGLFGVANSIAGNRYGFLTYTNSTGGTVHSEFQFYAVGAYRSLETSGTVAINNGNPHHIVTCVSNIASKTNIQLYIDGSINASSSIAYNYTVDDNYAKVYAGCYWYYPYPGCYSGRYLTGQLDEMFVTRQLLTASDVSVLYNGGTPLPYSEAAATSTISACIYGNIFDMNSVIGQTCTTDGATTTCTYDTSPTTTAVQVTSGDLIFGLAIVIFILILGFAGFVFNSFNKK